MPEQQTKIRVTLRKFKTYTKKKGLNRVADEETTRQLHQLIDELCQYRAASSYKAHLRSTITGVRTNIKAHVSERLTELNQMALASTTYGDVNIMVVDKVAHNTEYYDKVLEELNLIEEFKSSLSTGNSLGKFKCKLVVKTTSLNSEPEVMEKSLELVRELEARFAKCEIIETDSIVDEQYHKFIAPRLAMAKEIQNDAMIYNQIYNKIKVLFESVSTGGNYPRVFSYKGFVMYWEDIYTSSNYADKVRAFIAAKDFRDGLDLKKRYKVAHEKLCKQDNLITHRYLLDQEDYLSSIDIYE